MSNEDSSELVNFNRCDCRYRSDFSTHPNVSNPEVMIFCSASVLCFHISKNVAKCGGI